MLQQEVELGFLDLPADCVDPLIAVLSSFFAEVNECERIPVLPLCQFRRDRSCRTIKIWKDRVAPNAPEPVPCVARVLLAAVYEAMPIAAVLRFNFLSDLVRRVQKILPEKESCS